MSQKDPFEVLGVEPSATESEINAAYRKLARAHHPDQHPGDSPEQRRRRESVMAEINAAHDALRDGWERPPVVRPTASQGRPPPSRPRVPPPPPTRAEPAQPTTEPPSGEPVSPWRVLTVLGFAAAAFVGLVAVIVIVISPESDPTPTEDQPIVVDIGEWTVGTCVSSGPQAEAVRCEFPNRGMVIADVFTADQCPAGTDAYALDPPRVLCIDFDA